MLLDLEAASQCLINLCNRFGLILREDVLLPSEPLFCEIKVSILWILGLYKTHFAVYHFRGCFELCSSDVVGFTHSLAEEEGATHFANSKSGWYRLEVLHLL